MSKYDPAEDTRVIAVKDWADSKGRPDLYNTLSDWDIAMRIQFTRSDEGALRKFLKSWDIDFNDYLPKAPKRVCKDDIMEELIGWERPACPTCWLVPSTAGGCECNFDETTTALISILEPRKK